MSNQKGKQEKNQIYCTFFQRAGACMHGEACSRMHIRPLISKTLLLSNIYPNPLKFISLLPENTLIIEPNTLARNFDEFYIDIYEELRKYGPIEDLLVSGNLCDHLVGNVLVRFVNEEDSISAINDLKSRFYAGRPIDVQFSPVYNFEDATCKQFFENQCRHGDNCNFIHPKFPSDSVLQQCQLAQARRERPSRGQPHDRQLPRRESSRDNRDHRDSRDSRDNRDSRDSREFRDARDSRMHSRERDFRDDDRNYDRRRQERHHHSQRDSRDAPRERSYDGDRGRDRDRDRERERDRDRTEREVFDRERDRRQQGYSRDTGRIRDFRDDEPPRDREYQRDYSRRDRNDSERHERDDRRDERRDYGGQKNESRGNERQSQSFGYPRNRGNRY
ncbi:Splicing factor U2af small subunit A [Tritrichomonas foetus]|uniref:Splicing factor U2af small subunit A n=1 Tax=Tritrichomonas foetus TaxID=1144522 RepID=A0A1J4KKE2_9EUKA|nr:Splicing factor U2af small subunit A [Tritrichomonas foetus]|eukprot:OHT11602.1 Splicing factor U2af small subunit A [Tritrichomonas foetus]